MQQRNKLRRKILEKHYKFGYGDESLSRGINEVALQVDRLAEIVQHLKESDDSAEAESAIAEIHKLTFMAKNAIFQLSLFEQTVM